MNHLLCIVSGNNQSHVSTIPSEVCKAWVLPAKENNDILLSRWVWWSLLCIQCKTTGHATCWSWTKVINGECDKRWHFWRLGCYKKCSHTLLWADGWIIFWSVTTSMHTCMWVLLIHCYKWNLLKISEYTEPEIIIPCISSTLIPTHDWNKFCES